MLERYSRPEMSAIWTEENKYQAWLEVEILADEAWAELGEIPKEDVAKIRDKASFDVDRILEIEQETRHDVVAFTRAVSESLGEERKWVHYGLTSTDVVDTAYGYLFKQANDVLRADLERFTAIIADKAREHKFTIMMGRRLSRSKPFVGSSSSSSSGQISSSFASASSWRCPPERS